jgi:hypothetical protein
MSAISRTTATAGAGAPRRTYITMRPYYYDFFTYTTSVRNFVTSGGLSKVTGASATLGQTGYCAEGAFLRETGKRIYPGANPGITTMMVSVFDFATGLTGFIDPNSEAFTPQNEDRAYYIDSAGQNPNSTIGYWTSDQGPPVYTHGNVRADGTLYISSTASTIGNAYFASNVSTVGNTAVGGNSHIRGNTSTMGNAYFASNVSTVGNTAVGGNESILGSLAVKGELKLFSPTTVGTTQMANTDPGWGGFQRHAVSGVNYNNTTSRVFLTAIGLTNTSFTPFYCVESVGYDGSGNVIPYAASTFWVVSRQLSNSGADTTDLNYMIVNQS